MRDFIKPFEILNWTPDAAAECARIRAKLEKKGLMIGPYDVQIAAHAKSLGFTVVTNNEREFRRVEGLTVENWCPMKS